MLAAGARSSASLRMLDSLGSASPARSPPGRAQRSRGGAGGGAGSRRTSADQQHQHNTLGHAHTLPPPYMPPLAQSMALPGGGGTGHLQPSSHHLGLSGSALNGDPHLHQQHKQLQQQGPAGGWVQAHSSPGAMLGAGAGGLGWVAGRAGAGASGQWDSERLADLDCCSPQVRITAGI